MASGESAPEAVKRLQAENDKLRAEVERLSKLQPAPSWEMSPRQWVNAGSARSVSVTIYPADEIDAWANDFDREKTRTFRAHANTVEGACRGAIKAAIAAEPGD